MRRVHNLKIELFVIHLIPAKILGIGGTEKEKQNE